MQLWILEHPIWLWMSIPTHHTWQSPNLVAEHVGIFLWLVTCRWQAHPVLWGISHVLLDPAVCCSFCHRGGIGGVIFEFSRRDVISTYPWRSWSPPTRNPVQCNNATAIGIANNTIKEQCLWAMEMRYFLVADKMAQDTYSLIWHPGLENWADYQS